VCYAITVLYRCLCSLCNEGGVFTLLSFVRITLALVKSDDVVWWPYFIEPDEFECSVIIDYYFIQLCTVFVWYNAIYSCWFCSRV